MKILKVQGKDVKIDDEDYNKVIDYDWRFSPDGYARATVKGIRYYLHKYIFIINNIPIKDKLLIDHKNMDKLDNQKINLRLANYKQNTANSIGRSKIYSKYKGVSYCSTEKRIKRWVAACEYDGKRITIGRYNDELEAAKAYNKKAQELWGNYARINLTGGITQ